MARPIWKLNNFSSFLYKNIFYLKINKFKKKKKIIFEKSLNIPSFYINQSAFIHKGNIFKKLRILKYYLGMKFGMFIITRKPFYFPENKKKSGKR